MAHTTAWARWPVHGYVQEHVKSFAVPHVLLLHATAWIPPSHAGQLYETEGGWVLVWLDGILSAYRDVTGAINILLDIRFVTHLPKVAVYATNDPMTPGYTEN